MTKRQEMSIPPIRKPRKNPLLRAWNVEPPQERTASLLRICLPYPPSLNKYWRHLKNGRTIISENGVAYRRHVCMVALMHRLAGCFPSQRLAVTMELVMPDRRTYDLDNSAKALFDALTKAQIWGDDSQVDDMRIIRRGVCNPGFVTLTIEVMP